MKYFKLRPLQSPRNRLALTYLGIIMTLSVGFSIIFYQTSTSALQLKLQDGQKGGTSLKTSPLAYGETPEQSSSRLNAQLQQQLALIRQDLVRRLVLFNIGALIGGGLFSYYLAQRTLRPIEAAMEAQNRFTSDASHELRTPLTTLLAEIEVALHTPNLTLARAKAALRSNHQEVTKLKKLSESLLDLAHKPLNRQTFTTLFVDELVSEAINQVLAQAQAKSIAITDTVPKQAVRGDAQSLIQACVILLDNAIKYSPPNKTVLITTHIEDRRLHLSIHNSGPGIRATDLPHIFERFYRADRSRSSQTHGYGLGLAIAKNIIEQHHGTLTATSSPGKGATFTIVLPA